MYDNHRLPGSKNLLNIGDSRQHGPRKIPFNASGCARKPD